MWEIPFSETSSPICPSKCSVRKELSGFIAFSWWMLQQSEWYRHIYASGSSAPDRARGINSTLALVCLSAPGTCYNLLTNRTIKRGSHNNNQRNVIVCTLKTAKENCQFCLKALETMFKSELPREQKQSHLSSQGVRTAMLDPVLISRVSKINLS